MVVYSDTNAGNGGAQTAYQSLGDTRRRLLHYQTSGRTSGSERVRDSHAWQYLDPGTSLELPTETGHREEISEAPQVYLEQASLCDKAREAVDRGIENSGDIEAVMPELAVLTQLLHSLLEQAGKREPTFGELVTILQITIRQCVGSDAVAEPLRAVKKVLEMVPRVSTEQTVTLARQTVRAAGVDLLKPFSFRPDVEAIKRFIGGSTS